MRSMRFIARFSVVTRPVAGCYPRTPMGFGAD
jgi:hypothetical protein